MASKRNAAKANPRKKHARELDAQSRLDLLAYYERMDRAHVLVSRAVKSGVLPSPKGLPCVDCGRRSIGYDHRNYHKPLDVVPICHGCNIRRSHATDYPYLRYLLDHEAALARIDGRAATDPWHRTRARHFLKTRYAASIAGFNPPTYAEFCATYSERDFPSLDEPNGGNDGTA